MKTKCLIALMASSVALVCTARADDMLATPTNSTAASLAAPVAAPDQDGWKFGVTVPLWAPRIDGNVTLLGRQQDVSIPFSTLKEHLDASASLAINVQKGKFGLFSSVGYMKFSTDDFGPGGGGANVWVGLKFLIVNAGASYLLVQTEGDHPFVLVGTAGIRYWYAATDITVTGPGGPPPLASGSNIQDLWDPVVGLRGSQYITQKLHLDLAGDIGGFDINNDTDFTWSATGMLAYDFTKWFTLSAGYQAIALDESNGSGTGKKGLNLIFNGAAVNLTFKF